MKYFDIKSGTTRIKMVAQHQTESIPMSGHPQAVVPRSAPSCLGGATMAIAANIYWD